MEDQQERSQAGIDQTPFGNGNLAPRCARRRRFLAWLTSIVVSAGASALEE